MTRVTQKTTVTETNYNNLREDLEKGHVAIEFQPVAPREGQEQTLYNVKIVADQSLRQVYLPTVPDSSRPMHLVHGCVIQDVTTTTLDGDSPSETDIQIAQLDALLDVIKDKHLRQLGLDPKDFPKKWTVQDTKGDQGPRENVWFKAPTNPERKADSTAKPLPKWDFDEWMKSKGIATFRIEGVQVIKASTAPPIQYHENAYIFRLGLGRFKLNLEAINALRAPRAKGEEGKRKSDSEAAPKKVAPKRTKLSKAAMAAAGVPQRPEFKDEADSAED
jgi:hypothetical protein